MISSKKLRLRSIGLRTAALPGSRNGLGGIAIAPDGAMFGDALVKI